MHHVQGFSSKSSIVHVVPLKLAIVSSLAEVSCARDEPKLLGRLAPVDGMLLVHIVSKCFVGVHCDGERYYS